MYKKTDRENRFVSMFNPDNGFYMRSGVLDKNGRDTGKDPFMASYPELIDVGIMETCVCAGRCRVGCYQKASERNGNNMPLEDFRQIAEESRGKCFSFALGGAGDPDTHENFEEILMACRENKIVPNFTTSGIAMTPEKAALCRKYCGAVAVSEHHADYTRKAVSMLLGAGVKTNIHYVLGKDSIDGAMDILRDGSPYRDINAVVFLLYKPVGFGRQENVLQPEDARVKEFFRLIDNSKLSFKTGFDSCTCPGIINFTKNTDLNTIDTCEGARFSAYIDASMNMMPCSFANQNPSWHVSLRTHSIKEAWDSEIFEKFRSSLRNSCKGCPERGYCMGGCPLGKEAVLCGRKYRKEGP